MSRVRETCNVIYLVRFGTHGTSLILKVTLEERGWLRFFSCFFVFGPHSTSNKMNQRREEEEEGDLENSGDSISPLRSIAFQRVKVCVSNPDY